MLASLLSLLDMFGPTPPPPTRRASGDTPEEPVRGGRKPDEVLSMETQSRLKTLIETEDEEWLLFIQAMLKGNN